MLLPILKKDPRTRLVGVCSATGKSSRLTAEQFGFAYCGTDAQAVIDDPGVNTVVIATRHHLHAAQTIAALNAGKHVFVEKPLCLNEEELALVGGAYRERGGARRRPAGDGGVQPPVRARWPSSCARSCQGSRSRWPSTTA